MTNKGKKGLKGTHGIPQTSSLELRGRQSVRATFKLSQRAVETLSTVSVHLGIKQKSLFDHLLEDTGSLRLIAKDMESENMEWPDRIQKTFVLSRKTLSCLEKTSEAFNTPRDALVEVSIQRLLPIIQKEREKQQHRKALLEELRKYLGQGQKILDKAKRLLGEDDPVYEKLEPAMKTLSGTQRNIEVFVEKGKIIEDF